MMHKKIYLLILLFIPFLAFATAPSPLPVDQAFSFTVKASLTDSVLAEWRIAPGYYLYKDRFALKVLSPETASIGYFFMPKGIEKTDRLGQHEVYENHVALSIPFLNPSHKSMELLITYQGCAAWGFCYPPETRLVTLKNTDALTDQNITIAEYIGKSMPAEKVLPASASRTITAPQSRASDILQQDNTLLALAIFFGFGLLLAFTPCVLPMIPILSGIIVGHGKHISTKKAAALSLTYVLGMASSFALAGVLVALLGGSIQVAMQQTWVIVFFSLIFVLLALSLFGFYELQLPSAFQEKITRLSRKQQAGHYLSVFVMGVLSTLIVSPCVSAPLAGALIYIGKTGDVWFGGSALFLLALGMGTPLIIIGSSFGNILPKAGHWMNAVKNFFGIVMLGVAIWLLQRVIPGPATLFLWAALTIMTAIYMGALNSTPAKTSGKFWQGIGILFLVYGILLLVGAAAGNSDVFKPLANIALSHANSGSRQTLEFIPVKSVADVDQAIKQARGFNKPVMLDFYADWCASCKEMEKYTFMNPEVRDQLSRFTLLQADITANTASDRALMRHFGVIAPPTLLFFDTQGQENKAGRIVGEMNAGDFLQHLNQLFKDESKEPQSRL